MLDAELAKQFFVVAPRIFQFGCGRNDADPRASSHRRLDKPVEDLRIIEFFFCAANGNDVTALVPILRLLDSLNHGDSSCNETFG